MVGYITAQEAAEKWSVTTRQIQLWCKTDKLRGAQKWGRDWAIPEIAERPAMKHKDKKNKG